MSRAGDGGGHGGGAGRRVASAQTRRGANAGASRARIGAAPQPRGRRTRLAKAHLVRENKATAAVGAVRLRVQEAHEARVHALGLVLVQAKAAPRGSAQLRQRVRSSEHLQRLRRRSGAAGRTRGHHRLALVEAVQALQVLHAGDLRPASAWLGACGGSCARGTAFA